MSIAEIRKKKGYTQTVLANLVGVSQQQIAKYEAGLSNPSPKVAKRLASVLDISPAEAWAMIYGEENEK